MGQGLSKTVLAFFVGLAGMHPAAADIFAQPRKAAPVESQQTFNWSGPYFGGFAGVGLGNGSWNAVPKIDFNVAGGSFGGVAGWNFQFSQMVIGLEGDIAFGSLRGNLGNCIRNCEISNGLLATYRGRVGYSFGPWLPFATVGLAIGDIRTDRNEFRAGWALGGGVEYAVNDWLVARIDYLHVDFRGFSCGSACAPTILNDAQFREHNIRVGFVIPFWPKPKPCPDPDDPGPRCMPK